VLLEIPASQTLPGKVKSSRKSASESQSPVGSAPKLHSRRQRRAPERRQELTCPKENALRHEEIARSRPARRAESRWCQRENTPKWESSKSRAEKGRSE